MMYCVYHCIIVVVIVNPGIKVEENYKPYTDGMEKKVFIMVCVYFPRNSNVPIICNTTVHNTLLVNSNPQVSVLRDIPLLSELKELDNHLVCIYIQYMRCATIENKCTVNAALQ